MSSLTSYGSSHSAEAARQAQSESSIALVHASAAKLSTLPPQPGPKYYKKSHWRKICLDKCITEAEVVTTDLCREVNHEPPPKPASNLLNSTDATTVYNSLIDTLNSGGSLTTAQQIDLCYLHTMLQPPTSFTIFLPTTPPISIFDLTPLTITPYMDPEYMGGKPGRGQRKASQVAYLSLVLHRILLSLPSPPSPASNTLTLLEIGAGPGYFAVFSLYISLSQYCPLTLHAILNDRKGVGLAKAMERWSDFCTSSDLPLSLSQLSIAEQSASDPLPPFDVALGLHTCGPLTDIILHAARASPTCAGYVISPCCYAQIVGRASAFNNATTAPTPPPPAASTSSTTASTNFNITNNNDADIVSHPRSNLVKQKCIECNVQWPIGLLGTGGEMSVVQSNGDDSSEDKWEYTHTHPAYITSKKCMNLIDLDRSLQMTEQNWECGVDTLIPITATPKNQIIWGFKKFSME
jgi:hypothetical protein